MDVSRSIAAFAELLYPLVESGRCEVIVTLYVVTLLLIAVVFLLLRRRNETACRLFKKMMGKQDMPADKEE